MKRWNLIILLCALAWALAACTRTEVRQTREAAADKARNAATRVWDAFDVQAPLGARVDPAQREQQRFDEKWRELESFRGTPTQQAVPTQRPEPPEPPPGFRFVTGVKESFANVDAGAINAAPVSVPLKGDVKGPSVLKAQVYLDRAHFSVGAVDGRWGKNSAIAVWWYQRSRGLPTTGEIDETTFRGLAAASAYAPALSRHRVTAEDVKGPFVTVPEDVYDKEKLDCLCYESVREKLAERFHADQDFLELLNENVKFSELKEGDEIVVPNVRPPLENAAPDIARVVISIAGNSFNGYDGNGNLVLHAPTTIGSKYDPSPSETVAVKKIVHDPHFHYQPTLFHEVPDTDPEAHLQPGPNSPVGVVWIALTKPHYGVHGTSDPESIGYASSHGCVRLTNWDAAEVAHRISEGTPIAFADARTSEAAKAAESP